MDEVPKNVIHRFRDGNRAAFETIYRQYWQKVLSFTRLYIRDSYEQEEVVLLGCDIEYIPEETMRIITNPELIAVNQDPLGLQAHVVRHEGETNVFAKDTLRRHGRARAVALYNPSDSAASFSVPAQVLEFAGEMRLRDLNLRSDLAPCGVIEMTLPPHTAKILRVERGHVGIPFDVELRKGENDVRISGVTSPKAAFDCMRLLKL